MSHLMHGAPVRARFTRLAAAGAGAALVLAGGIAVGNEITRAFAAPGEPGACTNPLTSAGGFTVFVEQDATFGNAETEGTIFAGGTLRWTKDYPVVHSTGLTPTGYALPTATLTGLGTVPVRIMAGSYDLTTSNSILAVTSAHNDTAAQLGYAVAGTSTWTGAHNRDSGKELKLNGSATSPDTSPAIQLTGPLKDTPISGGSAGATALAAQLVAPAAVTSVLAGTTTLRTESTRITALATAGSTATVNVIDGFAAGSHGGNRSLTLVAGRTNIVLVDAADLGGFNDLQFLGGVVPSATTPLVLELRDGGNLQLPDVAAGLSTNAATPNPYAAYTLWNYSGTAPLAFTGNRVSGTLLAPFANVSANANSPVEGQIVAKNLVTSGGEIHHYGFEGCIARDEEPTTTAPTTTEPSTGGSTTTEPSTGGSTTTAPTTTAPTTTAPTTTEPTTTEPSTEVPTTTEPSTEEPTTTEPSVDETTTSNGGVGDQEGDGESTDPSDGGVGDQEGDGDDELPTTGAEAVGAALLALTLAGGGLALLAARRRQQA